MLATARPLDISAMPTSRDPSNHMSSGLGLPNARDMNNLPLRRIPKLAARNKSTEHAPQVTNNSHTSEDISNEIRPVLQRSEQGSDRSIQTIASVPISRTQQEHRRQGSSSSTAPDQPTRHRQAKRKSAGVLGFLTLKEPSTSALEAYAEHEKKKAAQKGSKSVAMVMPGVSSQRLPEHVPKVNSKWDGLPDAARRKSTHQKDQDDRDKRTSFISLNTSGNNSPRRVFGSLSSKPSIRQSHDKKRPAVLVTEIGQDDRPESQRSAVRGRQRTYSDEGASLSGSSMLPSPERGVPEVPSLHGYTSGTATSPDASPRTPAADMTSFPISDSEDIVTKSVGPNVLAPPLVTRKPSNQSGLDTTRLAPAISPSRPVLVRDFSQPRIDSAVSPVSTSKGPMKPKKDDVAPWEMFEPPPEPASPAVSTSQDVGKRSKRFGYKLGKK